MTFELLSDTHLNMWKYTDEQINAIFPGGPQTLILAGDIGDPDDSSLHRAIQIACKNYTDVFYVPGNHEFYNRVPGSKKTPASTLDWFQKLDDQWQNFHFLYRRTEVVGGVRLVGATGWSSSPQMTLWSNMISEEGKKDIDYIQKQLSMSKEPTLVITHYPSTLRVLQAAYKDTLSQFDYAQDLERLFVPPLHTWVFGHVHQKHDFMIPYSSMAGKGEVRILCNPYGYPNEGVTASVPKPFVVTANKKGEARSLYGMSYRTL